MRLLCLVCWCALESAGTGWCGILPLSTDGAATVPPSQMVVDEVLSLSGREGESSNELDLSFGITPNFEADVNTAYRFSGGNTGLAYPGLEAKWNFSSRGGTLLALDAQHVVSTRSSSEESIAIYYTRQMPSANIYINLGHVWSGRPDGNDHFDWGLAATVPISPKFSAAIEATGRGLFHGFLGSSQQTEYVTGLIYTLSPNTEYAFGLGYSPAGTGPRLRVVVAAGLSFNL